MGSGSQTGKPSAQLRGDTSEAKKGHDLAQCASHPQIVRVNDPKLHFCFVLNNIINTGKEKLNWLKISFQQNYKYQSKVWLNKDQMMHNKSIRNPIAFKIVNQCDV